ncbi:MAG: (2Fe-2S)-binding protein [Hyphomicrobium sp.]|jgi:isoquinoline 1-oxidoreductase alpha subunit|nr:(2Fe-2S)-binding protein [Hyphomicrobium sp.]
MTKLTINGRELEVAADLDTPLLWVLRDELGLTGAKYGCGQALCGACVVYADGAPIRACVIPVESVAGQKITTPEGLDGRVADAVRSAWTKHDVAQCGYCQPGQIMTAIALLNENPAPTDAEIDDAMNANICRCATYGRIRTAIKTASEILKG